MSKPILRARGLHKAYVIGRAPLLVLRGVTLEADRAEFLVIQGPSGSGKSTLLHLLGALDLPDRGSVEFDGRNLFEANNGARAAYRNRDVGFVFQFYHLLPELNVLENVVVPCLVGHSLWRWRAERRKARRNAEEMLERVGLRERARHRPNQGRRP